MRVERGQIVAGQPIKRVRDFLRQIRWYGTSPDEVATAFGVTQRDAEGLICELVAGGYVEPARRPGEQERYQLGREGRRLANVRFVKRISRSQARTIIDQFLGRVQDVNRREELTHMVSEVRVFGSYLQEDAQDLGDIDLAIGLERREVDGVDWNERCLARAEESGRSFGSYFDQLEYSEKEVWLILKARSLYLSFHTLREPERLGCRSEVLFKAQQSQLGTRRKSSWRVGTTSRS